MFIKTDGGKTQDGFHHEEQDCTVRAISIAFNTGYKFAHDIMKSNGRKDKKSAAGFVNIINCNFIDKIEWYKEKYELKTTLKRFLKENPSGTYVLRISGHVFTVKNGIIHDLYLPRLGSHLKTAWKVK